MFAYYPQDIHQIINSFAAPSQNESYGCRRRTNRRPRQSQSHSRDPFQIFFDALVPEEVETKSYDTKINPKVQLSSDAAAYGIEAEIPGFAREQIDIEFDNKTLKLSGSTAKRPEPISTPVALTPEVLKQVPAPSVSRSQVQEGRGRSLSPASRAKRTSIEEVRDESESDPDEFVQIDAKGKTKRPLPDDGPVLDEAFPDPEERAPEVSAAPAAPATTEVTVAKEDTISNQTQNPVHTRSFEYSVELPKDIDRDNVSAELKDGILRVRVGRVSPDVYRRKIVIS